MKKNMSRAVIGVLILGLVAIGCETTGQSTGLGAGLGAVAGGIIGHQSGNAVAGAAIGAVVGGAAGYLIHKAEVRRSRNAQQTVQDYPDYQPAQGFKMDIKRGTVEPQVIAPGGTVTATMEYAALGTGGGREIQEERILKKGGEQIAVLDQETAVRSDGTYVNTLQFEVPKDAAAGEYTLAQGLNAGGASVQQSSTFRVSTQAASAR